VPKASVLLVRSGEYRHNPSKLSLSALGLGRRTKIKHLIRDSGQELFVLNTAANNSVPEWGVLGTYYGTATV